MIMPVVMMMVPVLMSFVLPVLMSFVLPVFMVVFTATSALYVSPSAIALARETCMAAA